MQDKQSKKGKKRSKPTLHPRNQHKGRYDLEVLVKAYPSLKEHLILNKYNVETVDFFKPEAVKALNKAILLSQYGLSEWDIPDGFLCPPIPGRADYIHHAADLLKDKNFGRIPTGKQIICFDLGVGANCIYPIIGVSEYDWSFIGSDIEVSALNSSKVIINTNEQLKEVVELRHQDNKKDCFYGVMDKEEIVDLVVCNPPFHRSAEEALEGSTRKVRNLTKSNTINPILNFSGQSNELWTDGGEERFIRNMMKESKKFSHNTFWFSTLVSKASHLTAAEKYLQSLDAFEIRVVPMGQGNKSSRLLAWTFLNTKEQFAWAKLRWT